MADYQMTLSFGSSVIHIPVLPEKLTVKSPGKNETTTVLELGEVSLLRRRGLRQVSWESHFPAHDAPYVSAWEGLSPVDYVRDIEDWRDTRESGRLSITGTDLNINMAVAVEDFSYEERGGEVGDIYYSLTLKEWKDYSAVTVSLPSPSRAVKSAPKRSGKPAAASSKTHTVVNGDCLWAIAQKYYGDGSRYPDAVPEEQGDHRRQKQGYRKPEVHHLPRAETDPVRR